MSAIKVQMGQVIYDMHGQPYLVKEGVHSETMSVVSRALGKLPSDLRDKAFAIINAETAKPLTMCEITCVALTAVHRDDSPDKSTILRRTALAMKCNRLGRVKLDESQRAEIDEAIHKVYKGGGIYSQAARVLNGETFDAKDFAPAEGDEPDE